VNLRNFFAEFKRRAMAELAAPAQLAIGALLNFVSPKWLKMGKSLAT